MTCKKFLSRLLFIFMTSTVCAANSAGPTTIPVTVINNLFPVLGNDYSVIHVCFSNEINPGAHWKPCSGDGITLVGHMSLTINKKWSQCKPYPNAPYQCLLRFTGCDKNNTWFTVKVCTGTLEDANKIQQITIDATPWNKIFSSFNISGLGHMRCV